jgi:hypothetical protein
MEVARGAAVGVLSSNVFLWRQDTGPHSSGMSRDLKLVGSCGNDRVMLANNDASEVFFRASKMGARKLKPSPDTQCRHQTTNECEKDGITLTQSNLEAIRMCTQRGQLRTTRSLMIERCNRYRMISTKSITPNRKEPISISQKFFRYRLTIKKKRSINSPRGNDRINTQTYLSIDKQLPRMTVKCIKAS